jgi:hypothetical protein
MKCDRKQTIWHVAAVYGDTNFERKCGSGVKTEYEFPRNILLAELVKCVQGL